MKEFISVLILFTLAGSAKSQEPDQVDRIVEKIYEMYESDSANILFDLNEIPKNLIKRMEEFKDSAVYSDLAYEGKSRRKQKENDAMFKRLKERSKKTPFIANNQENWRATDAVPIGGTTWPTRKFLFGVSAGADLFFFYWHGGRGKHLHLVFIENNNYSKLTGFVTLNNSNIIDKLDFDNKLKELKSNKLDPLVKRGDITVQEGHIKSASDMF